MEVHLICTMWLFGGMLKSENNGSPFDLHHVVVWYVEE